MSAHLAKRTIFYNIIEIAFNFIFSLKQTRPPSTALTPYLSSSPLYTLHVHLGPHLQDNSILIDPKNIEVAAIRKAKKAGYQAAKTGLTPLTPQQLIKKQFNGNQILAYKHAYQNSFIDIEVQRIRKIRLSAYQAAKYGCKRPSPSKLKARGYSPEEKIIYYNTYDQSVGTEEEQLNRRAYRMARQIIRYNLKLPTHEQLTKRGLNENSIAYFYKIYEQKGKEPRNI